ncbi:hypothetical protein SNE35_31975, partial [Paucibacter sp. R3-3]
MILVTKHQNSPSNAHAYRLLIFKDHQEHQTLNNNQGSKLFLVAPISDQHRSEIMTCFLKHRQAFLQNSFE